MCIVSLELIDSHSLLLSNTGLYCQKYRKRQNIPRIVENVQSKAK